MTPVPILVQAERVRQPTYRFRYAIAPLPPQTSLSAKCRTLSAGAVLAPLVGDKKPAKRDRYHAWTRTLSSATPRAAQPQPVLLRAVLLRDGRPRDGRP